MTRANGAHHFAQQQQPPPLQNAAASMALRAEPDLTALASSRRSATRIDRVESVGSGARDVLRENASGKAQLRARQNWRLVRLDRSNARDWVFDAEIRGFFHTIEHGRLGESIECRVGDRPVVRLILKWRNSGALEDGPRIRKSATRGRRAL